MANLNNVNKIFTESGRPNQGDNRSYYVKTLNKVLTDGHISISLSNNGKVWTSPRFLDKDGNVKEFNLEVRGYGFRRRVYCSNLDAERVLIEVSKFIKDPRVSESHVNSMKVSGKMCIDCKKCRGKGRILAFMHVCDGLCFDCYGTKYETVNYTVSV